MQNRSSRLPPLHPSHIAIIERCGGGYPPAGPCRSVGASTCLSRKSRRAILSVRWKRKWPIADLSPSGTPCHSTSMISCAPAAGGAAARCTVPMVCTRRHPVATVTSSGCRTIPGTAYRVSDRSGITTVVSTRTRFPTRAITSSAPRKTAAVLYLPIRLPLMMRYHRRSKRIGSVFPR